MGPVTLGVMRSALDICLYSPAYLFSWIGYNGFVGIEVWTDEYSVGIRGRILLQDHNGAHQRLCLEEGGGHGHTTQLERRLQFIG